jgi:hypothetical protein
MSFLNEWVISNLVRTAYVLLTRYFDADSGGVEFHAVIHAANAIAFDTTQR